MTLEDRIAQLATAGHKANAKQVVTGIAARIAKETGIPYEAIMGHTHRQPIAEARQVVMFEAREMGFSYPAIGEALNRDHSTIIAGYRREAARRGIVPHIKPRRYVKRPDARCPQGVTLSTRQLEDYRHLVGVKRLARSEALEILGVTA